MFLRKSFTARIAVTRENLLAECVADRAEVVRWFESEHGHLMHRLEQRRADAVRELEEAKKLHGSENVLGPQFAFSVETGNIIADLLEL
jgi:hypothetical protein